MEARYIVLIAVMYVSPISMVSSQEINESPYTTTTIDSRSKTVSPPTSATMVTITTTTTPAAIITTTTTTTTTTIMRRCSQDEECSPDGYCDNSTQRCELKYQWVHYIPELGYDNRLVYIDDYHNYLCTRLSFKNSDNVSYERYLSFISTIASNNTADNDTDYTLIEVLLIKHGEAKWVQLSNSTILNNAIEGGFRNKEMLYVCRIEYDSFHYAGHIQPSNGSCYVHNLEKYYGIYELLVHEM